ncbi:MAG: serine hydrolase [Lachnospiraceae bacterium]|nr:serine hydrolase [Lachnospiraceae bacterium]
MSINNNSALINSLNGYISQKHYRLVNSVLLYKDGELVLEQYYNKFTKESRNNLKSVWKSIIAICAGICLDKGFIKSFDEPVSNYINLFDGNRHPYHQMLKIKHLLTMTSGIYWNGGIHYHCPMVTQCLRSGNAAEYISDIYMQDLPGSTLVYKEWDVMLVSLLLQKASGMNVYDFCNEYLYKPLGIQSGRWFTAPDGLCYTIPGNNYAGIDGGTEEAKSDLTARDMAAIGILMLNRGYYNGKRIITEELAEQITTPASKILGYETAKGTKWMQEYGMFWWVFNLL